jgi:hypothetical protein
MAYVPISVHAAKGRQAEETVVNRLLQAGAESDRTAVELTGLQRLEQRRLRRLIESEVVREVPKGGRYWVDREAWAARQAFQLRLVLLFALLAIVVVVVAILYGK